MAAPMYDFDVTRKTFQSHIKKAVSEQNTRRLHHAFAEGLGSDAEKKLSLDQALRDMVFQLLKSDCESDMYKVLLGIAVECVSKEMCPAASPFIMLSDLFDGSTLDKCAQVFTYVEERVDTWKKEPFHTAGKNYLLRMCNDLLRRLSKSQNTLFCGRIQLFLARLFPLSEKSGLNLMSHFNVDNITQYISHPDDYKKARKQSVEGDNEEKMDFEEGETDDHKSSIPIDYNLYKKFWALQDYFRKPNQCYEKISWKVFSSYSGEVLRCFESYKLDDMKGARRKLKQLDTAQTQKYFAKYLTSEKLLDLQLSDSNFRRYVLVQYLILFQYLAAQVKFKNSTQTLNDDQSAWIKKTSDQVYQLLRETPPDGDVFASTIEHILSREENWNSWKNDGCLSYVREKQEVPEAIKEMRVGKKRSIGEDLETSEGKVIKLGSDELTRLWNLCPDNDEACRSSKRAFIPSLESYFEEAIDQADPAQMVEEQYKLVNNPTWAWKALRLLARSSSHFFSMTPHAGKKLPEYLENTIAKLAKTPPVQTQTPAGNMTTNEHEPAMKTEPKAEDDEEEDLHQDTEENLDRLQKERTPVKSEANMLTKDKLHELAHHIRSVWKKLASTLSFDPDDIAYLESETTDQSEQAHKMLQLWKENEEDKKMLPYKSYISLRSSLKSIGLQSTAVAVFGEDPS